MTITSMRTEDLTKAGRYLAGELSDTERAAFEEQLQKDPDVLREVEATARLKVGLAKLRELGELDALLAPPPWYRRNVVLATAAMLAIVVLGVMLVRIGPFDAGRPVLAASVGSLVNQNGSALAVTGTVAVFRKRAETYDAVIESAPSAGAVELRVLPETTVDSQRYAAALARMGEDDSLSPVASVTDLTPAADGFVTLFIDTSQLSSGRYRLDVTGHPQDADEVPAGTFLIRVVPAK